MRTVPAWLTASLLLFLVALGASMGHPVPAAAQQNVLMTPELPDNHTLVNGCDPNGIRPPGPFGLCLDGLPHFFCCSDAAVEWSGVVAGSRIDIDGSVPIDPSSGRPQSTAILLFGPGGWRREIPVAPSGAFGRKVEFAVAGTYQIGVLYHGQPADLEQFMVAWKYRVISGRTLSGLFPDALTAWPENDLFLAAPLGKRASWRLVLADAAGVPQPDASLGSGKLKADAHGILTLSFGPSTNSFEPPNWVAAGLYVQTYVDIARQGSSLTGFPDGGSLSAASLPEFRSTYYDAASFLSQADNLTPAGIPSEPGYHFGATDGIVTLFDGNSGVMARIRLATGTVQIGRLRWPSTTMTWTDVGTVHPVVAKGRVYLTLRDLTVLSRAVAWAAPDGRGGMLFSTSWLP